MHVLRRFQDSDVIVISDRFLTDTNVTDSVVAEQIGPLSKPI
jgi:hypothetical protein